MFGIIWKWTTFLLNVMLNGWMQKTLYSCYIPGEGCVTINHKHLFKMKGLRCTEKILMAALSAFLCFSGSTGKPKGVVHTQAGYMIYAATTFKYVFDYHPDDIYWCTADVGWITGHTYVTYGPLANGATGLIVSCYSMA